MREKTADDLAFVVKHGCFLANDKPEAEVVKKVDAPSETDAYGIRITVRADGCSASEEFYEEVGPSLDETIETMEKWVSKVCDKAYRMAHKHPDNEGQKSNEETSDAEDASACTERHKPPEDHGKRTPDPAVYIYVKAKIKWKKESQKN